MRGQVLGRASHEWKSRPDDQRFLTLQDLHESVLKRKTESWTATPRLSDLRVTVGEEDAIMVDMFDPSHGERRQVAPSNWGFGQLCQVANAPAAYMRKLPAELAAIDIQYGLEKMSLRDDALMLCQTNGHDSLRAVTSTSYGRIWDSTVVEAIEKVNQDGRWVIPSASYAARNPLRATTLYASDRDVFIFLVDPKNPVEVGGEHLFRGFYIWNSEVGAATFGLTTFLYRTVCDNRLIWGATDVKELRIRHTGGAPERFAYEGHRYLEQYGNESTAAITAGIAKAQATNIPINKGKDETVQDWLQDRGFTKTAAQASVETAQAEEGKARTIWDIVNGVTAYARSIPRTDERIELEVKAGKLMQYAAA